MIWSAITRWATGAWGYIAAALAAVAGVFAVYRSGKKAAEGEQARAALKKEAENVQTANETQRDITASKPDDVRKRLLDDWSRD